MKILGMGLGVLLVSGLLAWGCSNSSFQTTDKTTADGGSGDSNAVAGKEGAGKLDEAEEESGVEGCALATGADKSDVVSVSHGDLDVSEIEAGSVLRLRIQGQAVVDLSSSELPELKGICLDVRGNGSAQILIDGKVPVLFYRGRGNGNVSVDFQDTGSLDNLDLDVRGNSTISLSGSQLDCDALKMESGGSSQVQCSGI